MKKFIGILAACFFALPSFAFAQQYTAQAGVSLITGQAATATYTGGATRLPSFSGSGTLNITGVGIAGSPSGCSIALKYQQNNATTATAAVVTQAFTPGNTAQQFAITPTVATGDNYVAVYACSTYPTAGTLYVSLSPTPTDVVASVTGTVTTTAAVTGDPCVNPNVAKSSVAVNISGAAGTTQLVALSAGKAVYACAFSASVVGTSPTILLEYGTGTTCGTGTTSLTGTFAVVTTSQFLLGWGGTITAAPASNALCLLAGGTTPSIQGVLTYVQQ